jgi:hypothetical protein
VLTVIMLGAPVLIARAAKQATPTAASDTIVPHG